MSPDKTRSEIKRDAIINAAKKAFKEFGVQATSMDKLAELANVSKRTVYNHFATKEALLMHLVNELWQQAEAQIDLPYDTETPLQDQLSELILSEIIFICTQEHIDVTKVAIGHYFYNADALQKEFDKISCAQDGIYRWLSAAVADNKLAITNLDFAYDQLESLIKGCCFWPQLFQIEEVPTQVKMKEYATETALMFLARYQKE